MRFASKTAVHYFYEAYAELQNTRVAHSFIQQRRIILNKVQVEQLINGKSVLKQAGGGADNDLPQGKT